MLYTKAMQKITFVTGNQSKADYLARYLGFPIDHQKLDLVEIQSLDLQEIVEHKVRQAYDIVKGPVLVEDVSLEFEAFGRLPGTFIKFYVDEVPFETICRSLDGLSRNATARCVYGYCDGTVLKFFEGKLEGSIAQHPAGENGYGWDKIFVPNGYNKTRAELDAKEDETTYMQIKRLPDIKTFLKQHQPPAE